MRKGRKKQNFLSENGTIEDDRNTVYRFLSESNGNYVGDHSRSQTYSVFRSSKIAKIRLLKFVESKRKLLHVTLQIFRNERRKRNLF